NVRRHLQWSPRVNNKAIYQPCENVTERTLGCPGFSLVIRFRLGRFEVCSSIPMHAVRRSMSVLRSSRKERRRKQGKGRVARILHSRSADSAGSASVAKVQTAMTVGSG